MTAIDHKTASKRDNSCSRVIRIFDPKAVVAGLDEDGEWDDGGYIGPQDDRPTAAPRPRTTEDEVWARTMRKIIADPQRGYRRVLIGNDNMVGRLRAATATMPHFAAVTGIIERAVQASAYDGETIRFPPILMLSEPGVGKSFFARSVAAALGTTTVSIALNATSDKGQLGGLSSSWRGAKLGKLAKTILFDCATASPIFLLDEADKCSNLSGEDVSSTLLSVLEPENARSFVDEYINIPLRLDLALFLLSANRLETISPPVLSRMVVVEVPRPSEQQARTIVRAVAKAAVDRAVDDDAVELLLDVSARKVRQAIELAYPITVCAGRDTISADDMRRALDLVDGGSRRCVIGFTRSSAPSGPWASRPRTD